MVADLLEAQEEEQDLRLARPPVRAADPREERARRRAVERGLLAREARVLLRLDLLGEVGRDAGVGLRPAEEERRRDVAQARRGLGLAAPLDRDDEVAAERLVGAEEAGVQEVEDGLQLGEAVLDRRARERGAARGPQRPHGARLGGRRVLDVLRLVEREVLPVHLREERPVAVGERVGRDEEVDVRERAARNASPLARSGPWWTATLSVGAKRAASETQFSATDVGQTRSDGPIASPASRAARSVARNWTVLPSPMSSARQAPSPRVRRNRSQATPRTW